MNERFGQLANWLVLLACIISAGNAFSRYTINLSSNAWLEVQWYMFGAMVMLGAPYTLKMNEHVRVDVLYGNVSTRVQIWIDILGGIFFLLPAMIIIGWMSWPMFVNSWAINETSANAGGLLRWPVKLLVPLGFLLISLQGISEIIKRAGTLTGHCAPPPQYEKPLQ
jgi:TRAP-type mannitol/chloroaromatic compound transport system permease small subunit